MSCYSYSSNDPIYFEPNIGIWSVERVYNVGDTYSYAAIARMCEIADKDQLCVYTRPSPTGTETKLTLNIDYTVNTANERIDLINVPASGQVVVRRCTSNTKMFIPFTEGAKLTAQQLNTSLYQLLFIAQEKEFVGSTINEFYPIAIAASAWNSGTAYVTNNYVLHNGNIYKAVANNTNSQPPSASWTLVNPATNGFVIEGNLSGPVKFDLTGATVGKGLIWNGTKFEAGYISGPINDLSDVTIISAQNKQILQYDSTVSQWKNVSPTVDITLNSPIFQNHIFVNNATSYTNNSLTFPTIASSLNVFRTGLNNEWTIASIPTVWHALNLMTPGYIAGTSSTYFDNFLSNVNTIIGQVSQAVTNPIKVKLYWNLNKYRENKVDSNPTNDSLQNYKSTFWDHPLDFYFDNGSSGNMWTLMNNLRSHGVLTGGTVYKDNPYFSLSGSTYSSKLSGYGIQDKGFYLSIPECYTTSLCKIPILQTGGSPETYSNHVFTVASDLSKEKLTGLKTGGPGPVGLYSDTYLENIRDIACAASFSKPASGWTTDTATAAVNQTVKEANYKSRWAKGNLFSADYNGFQDISYRRLETDITYETSKNCLFKIPKQIIYYNKHALGFASSAPNLSTDEANWPNSLDIGGSSTLLSKQTRFTGQGSLNYTTNANSSVTSAGIGSQYKADEVWNAWCQQWSGTTDYTFNEADIEWITSNIHTSSGTILDLYSPWNPSLFAYGRVVSSSGETVPQRTFPWVYRSSYFDKFGTPIDGYIGTHLMNVDMNKIFSESTNYTPDPRDEYVFRLVVDRNLISTFKKATSTDIASSIILEHGFTDSLMNGSPTGLEYASQIYRKNNIIANSHEARSRLNRNDIKVFIQNEHIERYDNTITNFQYVITLCVSVPRLKSIGYSRIYRAASSTNAAIWNPETGTTDLENDLGPWSFYFTDLDGLDIPNPPTVGIPGNPPLLKTITPADNSIYVNTILNDTVSTLQVSSPIAGRNECAVKFTRLGIPSDLWIRLSVLNTDGSLDLITTNGGWNTNI